jgi:polyketide biosynthesis 3-hydroxy-3-methylglutaryl-CoA synthase-like enzyme PksG
MDTCRPTVHGDAGDSDLSLLSYLDCCENAFLEYKKRVPGADYVDTFSYVTYHCPFGGMVKGAHRNMMRKMVRATKPQEIEDDFQRRVMPGVIYCQRVANIMGATMALGIASTIDNGEFETPTRIGAFSYGSGCCSEFFSGVVRKESQQRLRKMQIKERLDRRTELTMEEYDQLLVGSNAVKFGTRNVVLDTDFISRARTTMGEPVLFLKEIKEFHREYEWVG